MKPNGEINVENGMLKYNGVPAIIISRSTIGRLIREMYKLAGMGILRAFRQCGYEGGENIYSELVRLTGAQGEDLIDKFYVIEEDIGWGKYSIPRKEKDGCIVVVNDGWFAEALKGEVNHPVCEYLVGYFEALFKKIYGQEVTVKEELCSAKGDPYCEFHIKKQ